LNLPSYTDLTEPDVVSICEIVRDLLSELRLV
jgi:hypothetical protein